MLDLKTKGYGLLPVSIVARFNKHDQVESTMY